MGITADRSDPRLSHGVDEVPVPQAEVYLVLSDEERAQGWVRPYRDAYTHVGAPGPKHPLRDLTEEEQARYGKYFYVKYEEYPEGEGLAGSFWTQARLDNVGKGCGASTRMGQALSETYARDPHFYGATYCATCQKHRPVEEFVWDKDGARVGS